MKIEGQKEKRKRNQSCLTPNLAVKQSDGTSCISFTLETNTTVKHFARCAVLESYASSPTFNSGISKANWIKQVLKAYEGITFQLFFSLPDDSIIQLICPGDTVNMESHESEGSSHLSLPSMLGNTEIRV